MLTKRLLYYPDWLYNSLPYIYFGVGFLTMMLLRDLLGLVCGLVLMSAGAAVWTLRYRYRQAFYQSEGHISVPELSESGVPARALFQISWRNSFECGHPVIDGQHRRLFGLSNEVINAVLGKQVKGNVDSLMDELVGHITDHFCTQEAVLAKFKSPQLPSHKQQHQNLLRRAKELRERLQTGDPVAGELVSYIAYELITEHILKQDLQVSARNK